MVAKRRRLAERRKVIGYTQEALAEQLGIERSTVVRWERGETEPQPWVRPLLANALQVSLADVHDLLCADSCDGGRHHPRHFVPLQPVGESAASNVEDLASRIVRAATVRDGATRQNPLLMLVGGFAGSGKTEFGQRLSATTGWTLLDKDSLTRPLSESFLCSLSADANDRHTSTYWRYVRPLEYRSLLEAAIGNLAQGNSTILTAPFLLELPEMSWMGRVTGRCVSMATDLATVWVDADLESMYTYLAARDAARDTWKLSNWDDYVASIDLGTRPCSSHILVDNRRQAAVDLSDQVQRLAGLASNAQ